MKQVAALLGLMGQAKGDKIALEKDSLEIGSGPDCDIVIQGAQVSPLHAVLQRSSGEDWKIISKARAKVIVNKVPVSEQMLFAGDRLQFGSEALFEFVIDKPKKRMFDTDGGEKSSLQKGLKLIPTVVLPAWIIIGLLIYFSLTIGSDGEGTELTQKKVDTVLEETAGFLDGLSVDDSGKYALDDGRSRERAAKYFSLLSLSGQTGNDAAKQKQALIKEIGVESRDSLFRIWLLQSQGRNKEVVAEYGRIIEALPDVRVPLTAFALKYRKKIIDED